MSTHILVGKKSVGVGTHVPETYKDLGLCFAYCQTHG